MNAIEPRHLRSVERWTLALAALVIAAATVATSRSTAFAVAVGAGLMSLNAWAIRRIAERVFRDGQRIRAGAAVLLFNLKMLLLIALVLVAISVLHLDGIGFLVGVSVFPVAIVVAALRMNLGAEPAEGDLPSNGER
jgi:hypothetical protein